MHLQIRHETRYVYENSVSYSIQALKLTPRSEPGQRVLHWRITAPGERLEQVDPYGNVMHVVTVEHPHKELCIVVEGSAEIGEGAGPTLDEPAGLSPLAFLAPTSLTRPDTALRDLADRHLGRHPPSPATLMDLVRNIGTAVAYEPGMTDVTHTAGEALEMGAGVCQDQAHVLVACCRAAGVPARYVSGYFYAGDPGGVASHAWADVWLQEEQRWMSFDVTHAEEAGARHCRLAIGRDYLDAAPVRGVRRGGGQESMAVAVKVTSGQAQQ
jgi:transglutaminase-like putative cysteine protease